MPEPHHSELIFPSASSAPPLSALFSSLRLSALSTHNRLASIYADAAFVSQVAHAYVGRPLVANERCGSWYVDTATAAVSYRRGGSDGEDGGVKATERSGDGEERGRKTSAAAATTEQKQQQKQQQQKQDEGRIRSVYFKSTDGHERAWKFSTRRLNMHILPMIEENDGVIIVDSTRRGKKMPDALSTTIPIWCAVINMALFPSSPLSSTLFLPPSHSSPSIHAQISTLLPQFFASLKALQLDALSTNAAPLTKPLRPLWVTPEEAHLLPDHLSPDDRIFEEWRPVICCTASRRVSREATGALDGGGDSYIQGAGDDTENWARGLTPDIFWDHVDELLDVRDEALLIQLIERLVSKDKQEKASKQEPDADVLVRAHTVLPHLAVCALPLNKAVSSSSRYTISLAPVASPKQSWVISRNYVEVGLGEGKTASRNLRQALPAIRDHVQRWLLASGTTGIDDGASIMVACESGKDASVGVALALSCYFFDEQGRLRDAVENVVVDKSVVRARLGALMTAFPRAQPSRSTLQSVNSFLMDWNR